MNEAAKAITHETRAHAVISGSKMERVMACPGSIALSQFVPEQEESSYAKDGTITHQIIEEAMTLGVDAADICDDPIRSLRVQTALNSLREFEARGLTVQVEHELSSEECPDAGGISDAIIEDGGTLVVWDYKDGGGHEVSPEENPQLMFYALLYSPDILFKEYRFIICQPRFAGDTRDACVEWSCDAKRMQEFKAAVDLALLKVRNGIDFIESIELAATTGNACFFRDGDHCRWCPAKAVCPIKVREFGDISVGCDVSGSQDSGTDGAPSGCFPDDVPVGKSSKEVTPAELADLILREKHVVEFVKAWFEALKAQAREIIDNGGEIPGMKLVESLSNRAWSETEDVLIKRLSHLGIKKSQVTETKLMSPAKIEAIHNKEWVAKYTTRKVTGRVLVEESDPRPAVGSLSSVQAAFGDLPATTDPETEDLI